MTLNTTNWTRVKLATTLPEAIIQNSTLYPDTANGRYVLDFYATVNAALRLEKRFLLTPVYASNQLTFRIEELNYATLAASTYVATNLTTATTAPFTILAGGTPRVLGISNTIDLDALYTLAGDARANA